MTLAATTMPAARPPIAWGRGVLAALCFLLLIVFLVVPVATVIYVAFKDPQSGALTLTNFADFLRNDLFMRSLGNSLWVSALSVILATAFAMPLAYITMRFEISRRDPHPDAGRDTAHHSAICGSGCHAIAVRSQWQRESLAGRLV